MKAITIRRIHVCLAVTAGLLAAQPAAATFVPSVLFSTDTTQTIFNGGVRTLHHGNVYETSPDRGPAPTVAEFVPNFLPGEIGLDALQDMRDFGVPGFVFSTDRTGQIVTGGQPLQLFPGRVYYFDTDTSLVSVYEPLAGLLLGNIDALAAMPVGTVDQAGAPTRRPDVEDPIAWAFSTESVEHILQDGQLFTLHPGNIYCFNRLTGRTIVLAETGAMGVANVDALDAPFVTGRSGSARSGGPLVLAPIAFSPGRTQLAVVDGRLVRLLGNAMYGLLPSHEGIRGITDLGIEELFSGNAIAIRDLDAFSTPGVAIPPEGACPVSDPGFDYGPCDAVLGWVFDGSDCEEISGCDCAPNCEAFHPTEEACAADCDVCLAVDPGFAFGPCDAVLGWVYDGSGCVEISGCDCAPFCDRFHPSQAACESTCS